MAVRQPIDEPGTPIEHVCFPIDAVLSVLAVMDDGQAVEVATTWRTSVALLCVSGSETNLPRHSK